jgi:hypothetical protein
MVVVVYLRTGGSWYPRLFRSAFAAKISYAGSKERELVQGGQKSSRKMIHTRCTSSDSSGQSRTFIKSEDTFIAERQQKDMNK